MTAKELLRWKIEPLAGAFSSPLPVLLQNLQTQLASAQFADALRSLHDCLVFLTMLHGGVSVGSLRSVTPLSPELTGILDEPSSVARWGRLLRQSWTDWARTPHHPALDALRSTFYLSSRLQSSRFGARRHTRWLGLDQHFPSNGETLWSWSDTIRRARNINPEAAARQLVAKLPLLNIWLRASGEFFSGWTLRCDARPAENQFLYQVSREDVRFATFPAFATDLFVLTVKLAGEGEFSVSAAPAPAPAAAPLEAAPAAAAADVGLQWDPATKSYRLTGRAATPSAEAPPTPAVQAPTAPPLAAPAVAAPKPAASTPVAPATPVAPTAAPVAPAASAASAVPAPPAAPAVPAAPQSPAAPAAPAAPVAAPTPTVPVAPPVASPPPAAAVSLPAPEPKTASPAAPPEVAAQPPAAVPAVELPPVPATPPVAAATSAPSNLPTAAEPAAPAPRETAAASALAPPTPEATEPEAATPVLAPAPAVSEAAAPPVAPPPVVVASVVPETPPALPAPPTVAAAPVAPRDELDALLEAELQSLESLLSPEHISGSAAPAPPPPVSTDLSFLQATPVAPPPRPRLGPPPTLDGEGPLSELQPPPASADSLLTDPLSPPASFSEGVALEDALAEAGSHSASSAEASGEHTEVVGADLPSAPLEEEVGLLPSAAQMAVPEVLAEEVPTPSQLDQEDSKLAELLALDDLTAGLVEPVEPEPDTLDFLLSQEEDAEPLAGLAPSAEAAPASATSADSLESLLAEEEPASPAAAADADSLEFLLSGEEPGVADSLEALLGAEESAPSADIPPGETPVATEQAVAAAAGAPQVVPTGQQPQADSLESLLFDTDASESDTSAQPAESTLPQAPAEDSLEFLLADADDTAPPLSGTLVSSRSDEPSEPAPALDWLSDSEDPPMVPQAGLSLEELLGTDEPEAAAVPPSGAPVQTADTETSSSAILEQAPAPALPATAPADPTTSEPLLAGPTPAGATAASEQPPVAPAVAQDAPEQLPLAPAVVQEVREQPLTAAPSIPVALAAPEQPVAAPEQTPAAPEQPVVAPEQTPAAPVALAAPEQPVVAPEQTPAAPVALAAPEQPVVAPEQTPAAPVALAAPEQPVVAPPAPSVTVDAPTQPPLAAPAAPEVASGTPTLPPAASSLASAAPEQPSPALAAPAPSSLAPAAPAAAVNPSAPAAPGAPRSEPLVVAPQADASPSLPTAAAAVPFAAAPEVLPAAPPAVEVAPISPQPEVSDTFDLFEPMDEPELVAAPAASPADEPFDLFEPADIVAERPPVAPPTEIVAPDPVATPAAAAPPASTIEGAPLAPVAPPIEVAASAPVAPPMEVAPLAPVAPSIEATAPAPVAPPMEVAPLAPVAPPIEATAPAPVAPPIEVAAPAPVAPPIEVAAPAPVAPPIEVAAPAPVEPPAALASPPPPPALSLAAPPEAPPAPPAPVALGAPLPTIEPTLVSSHAEPELPAAAASPVEPELPALVSSPAEPELPATTAPPAEPELSADVAPPAEPVEAPVAAVTAESTSAVQSDPGLPVSPLDPTVSVAPPVDMFLVEQAPAPGSEVPPESRPDADLYLADQPAPAEMLGAARPAESPPVDMFLVQQEEAVPASLSGQADAGPPIGASSDNPLLNLFAQMGIPEAPPEDSSAGTGSTADPLANFLTQFGHEAPPEAPAPAPVSAQPDPLPLEELLLGTGGSEAAAVTEEPAATADAQPQLEVAAVEPAWPVESASEQTGPNETPAVEVADTVAPPVPVQPEAPVAPEPAQVEAAPVPPSPLAEALADETAAPVAVPPNQAQSSTTGPSGPVEIPPVAWGTNEEQQVASTPVDAAPVQSTSGSAAPSEPSFWDDAAASQSPTAPAASEQPTVAFDSQAPAAAIAAPAEVTPAEAEFTEIAASVPETAPEQSPEFNPVAQAESAPGDAPTASAAFENPSQVPAVPPATSASWESLLPPAPAVSELAQEVSPASELSPGADTAAAAVAPPAAPAFPLAPSGGSAGSAPPAPLSTGQAPSGELPALPAMAPPPPFPFAPSDLPGAGGVPSLAPAVRHPADLFIALSTSATPAVEAATAASPLPQVELTGGDVEPINVEAPATHSAPVPVSEPVVEFEPEAAEADSSPSLSESVAPLSLVTEVPDSSTSGWDSVELLPAAGAEALPVGSAESAAPWQADTVEVSPAAPFASAEFLLPSMEAPVSVEFSPEPDENEASWVAADPSWPVPVSSAADSVFELPVQAAPQLPPLPSVSAADPTLMPAPVQLLPVTETIEEYDSYQFDPLSGPPAPIWKTWSEAEREGLGSVVAALRDRGVHFGFGFMLDTFRTLLNRGRSGYLLLEGDAGVGKSWLGAFLESHAAALGGRPARIAYVKVQRRPHGDHETFTENMNDVLATSSAPNSHRVQPLQRATLQNLAQKGSLTSRQARFSAFLHSLAAHNRGPVLLYLDELDRRQSYEPGYASPSDFLPETLPADVYLVITYRSDASEAFLEKLNRLAPSSVLRHTLEPAFPDYRAQLDAELARQPGWSEQPGRRTAVAQASEFRLLAARINADAVSAGLFDLEALPTPQKLLPELLAALRVRRPELFAPMHHLLLTLCALFEPLPWSELDQWGSSVGTLQQVVQMVPGLLMNRLVGDRECVDLAHETLRDFLINQNGDAFAGACRVLTGWVVQKLGESPELPLADDGEIEISRVYLSRLFRWALLSRDLVTLEWVVRNKDLQKKRVALLGALDSSERITQKLGLLDHWTEALRTLVEDHNREDLRDELAWSLTGRGLSLLQLGRRYRALKDLDRAVALFEMLVNGERQTQFRNGLASAYNGRSELLFALGENEKAAQNSSLAVGLLSDLVEDAGRDELRPMLAMAQRNHASIQAALGNLNEASRALVQAQKSFSALTADGNLRFQREVAWCQLQAADLALRSGEGADALTPANQAVSSLTQMGEQHPKEDVRAQLEQAHLTRGRVYLAAGEGERAQRDFVKAVAFGTNLVDEGKLEQREKLAEALSLRGESQAQQGAVREAIRDLGKALDLRETLLNEGHEEQREALARDYSRRAELHRAERNPEAAQADLAQGQSLLETLAAAGTDVSATLLRVHEVRAEIGMSLGRFNEVAESAGQALTLLASSRSGEPAKLARLHSLRAEGRRRLLQLSEARVDLEAAVQLYTQLLSGRGDSEALQSLAEAYGNSAQVSLALGELERAHSEATRSAEALEAAGSDPAQTPRLAGALSTRGETLERQGHHAAALADLKRAVSLLAATGGNVDALALAYRRMARTLLSLGDARAAREASNEALSRYRDLWTRDRRGPWLDELSRAQVINSAISVALKEYGLADEELTRSIEHFAGLVNAGKVEYFGDLFETSLQRVRNLLRVNLLPKAHEEVGKLAELCLATAGAHPGLDLREKVARVLQTRAQIELRQGNQEGAFNDFEGALGQLQPLLVEQGRFDLGQRMADIYRERARMLLDASYVQPGLADQTQAVELLSALLSQGREELRRPLGRAAQERATIYQGQGDIHAAVSDLNVAIDLMRGLAARGEDADVFTDLANMSAQRGRCYAAAGESALAAADFEQAVQLYTRLVEHHGRQDLSAALAEILLSQLSVTGQGADDPNRSQALVKAVRLVTQQMREGKPPEEAFVTDALTTLRNSLSQRPDSRDGELAESVTELMDATLVQPKLQFNWVNTTELLSQSFMALDNVKGPRYMELLCLCCVSCGREVQTLGSASLARLIYFLRLLGMTLATEKPARFFSQVGSAFGVLVETLGRQRLGADDAQALRALVTAWQQLPPGYPHGANVSRGVLTALLRAT